MKNKISISFESSQAAKHSTVAKDFTSVLNQYQDYQTTRRKYFLAYRTLLLLVLLTIGFLLAPRFWNADVVSSKSLDIPKSIGPYSSGLSDYSGLLFQYDSILAQIDSIQKNDLSRKKAGMRQEQNNELSKPVSTDFYKTERAKPIKGFTHLYQYFAANLTYPEEQLIDSIEGVVKVLFTVKQDSSIADLKVIQSLGNAFDKEAIRLVERMPKWKPALVHGLPTRSDMIIPIRFQIEKAESNE